MIYTATQLIRLSQDSPQELVRLLTSHNTNTKILITGVEILCNEVKDDIFILPVIRMLLMHMNALVRESTMVGISDFYSNFKPPQDVIDRLITISINDPSNDLKKYAKDLLKNILKLNT